MEDLCLKILEQRGIKPTAIRMLVLKAMMETEQAVSLLASESDGLEIAISNHNHLE